MPTTLIGGSIGQVYFQQANIEKQETGNAVDTFTTTFKKLIILSVAFFVPLYFILPAVFEIVFGQEWPNNRRICKSHCHLWRHNYCISIDYYQLYFRKTENFLLWQGLLFLSVGTIVHSSYFQNEFIEFLKIFSGSLFLYYVLLLVILWRVSKGK